MSILSEAQAFLEKAESLIPSKHRQLEQIDHLCYRASDTQHYKNICDELKSVSHFLTESMVNGRPISCFYYNQGFKTAANTVHVIEVASPKQGATHQIGFEHIEIFSPDPNEEDLLVDNVRIKFCNRSLLSIIQSERYEEYLRILTSDTATLFSHCKNANDLLSALHDSRVLSVLNDFHPTICGTFPIGIGTEQSDIDIICQITSIKDFSLLLQKHFQKFNGFKIAKSSDHITCTFVCRDIPFEIYASSIAIQKQRAYVHMYTEAQLLAFTGAWATQEILKFKKQGLKTEPAFTNFFNISGDAYEALYDLKDQWQTINDLCVKKLKS